MFSDVFSSVWELPAVAQGNVVTVWVSHGAAPERRSQSFSALLHLSSPPGSKPSKVPPKTTTPNGWPTGWCTASSAWPSSLPTSSSPGSPSTTLERCVCVCVFSTLPAAASVSRLANDGSHDLLGFYWLVSTSGWHVMVASRLSGHVGLRAVSCPTVCLPGVVHGPHPLQRLRPDLQPHHSTIFPEKWGQNRWRGEEPEGQGFRSRRQDQRRRWWTLHTPTHTPPHTPLTLGLCSPRPQLRKPQQTSCLRRRRVPKQELWCLPPFVASL